LRTLEHVGLSDQIHKYPNQLSGGQQQRVAIARTLATNPDVILLDEPISALDVTNREIMKAELKSLQKKFNATMLFITHDQEEAFFLSDRIMVMNEGVIEQMDTPLEIYKNPANDYVREFVVEQLDKKYSDLLNYTGRSANEK
jgi:ABC-type proline/glycine betaine transport system ATPase subunit